MSAVSREAERATAHPAEPAVVQFDEALLRSNFDVRPFKVTHSLEGNELLSLPRIVELARELSPSLVEYNAGQLPLNQDYLTTPVNGLTAEETIERIENCHSWLVLKHVQGSRRYRELLGDCLQPILRATDAVYPGICMEAAFVFVSSPGSVTPYHMDPEHNFLLQVRGTKSMAVFDRADRTAVTEEQIESLSLGGHRNLPFDEHLHSRESLFQLSPGEGVHVPKVSISLSVTFRSKRNLRDASVYRTNARLRKLGISPHPPGHGVWSDTVKWAADRVADRLRRKSES
jgi:Cupin-like domain